MGNRNIREKASELVQNFIRQVGILKEVTVFNQIPDILTSVTIDKEIIRKIVIEELENNSKNPLNVFLKLFGIRLIGRGNKYDAESDFAGVRFNEALRIDEEKLNIALSQIAEFLSSKNNAFDKESLRLSEKYEDLRREYNRYREDVENQISAYQIQTKSVAMHVQYLLALRRKEAGTLADYTDLLSMLESMEMTAIWPEETEENLLPKMFTMLKIGIPSGAGVKPCIMLGQQVLLKGEIIEYVE